MPIHRQVFRYASDADELLARFCTLVIFDPGDEESFRRVWVGDVDIKRTEGFIDDSVKGEPVYAYRFKGGVRLRDRKSALRDYQNMHPEDMAEAAKTRLRLEEHPEEDIAQYGYALHHWHPG